MGGNARKPRATGWLENWSVKTWKERLCHVWVGHYEDQGNAGQVMQFDRVVVIPFDEAVKMGVVKKEQPQEKQHD